MIRELEALERKWREASAQERDYYADALRDCANQLRAILDGCAGEGEAVAWLIEMTEDGFPYTDSKSGEKRFAKTWPRRKVFLHNAIADYRDYPDARSTPLYTHPPAVVVDDAMVERAHAFNQHYSREYLRKWLAAALRPGA